MAEVSAHARPITALAVDPQDSKARLCLQLLLIDVFTIQQRIYSASADCHIAEFQVDMALSAVACVARVRSVVLKHTVFAQPLRIGDEMLYGLAATSTGLLAAAYDSALLMRCPRAL
jgi:hypothetical protein